MHPRRMQLMKLQQSCQSSLKLRQKQLLRLSQKLNRLLLENQLKSRLHLKRPQSLKNQHQQKRLQSQKQFLTTELPPHQKKL